MQKVKGQDIFLINIKLKFETGMSDFNLPIITAFKVKPDRLPPRLIKSKGYKNFERKAFNNKLQVSLKNVDVNNSGFIELKTIFMELLDKVASVKSI